MLMENGRSWAGAAVEAFLPKAFEGDAHPVIGSGHGDEVADHDEVVFRLVAEPHEAECGLSHVVAVDPLEPFVGKILPVQSRVPAVEPPHPALSRILREK